MIGAAAAKARGVHPRTIAHNLVSTRGLAFRTAQVIERIAKRFGRPTALEWIRALTKYQSQISDTALRNAIISGNVQKIAAALDPHKLQMSLGKGMQLPLSNVVKAAGLSSSQVLRSQGIQAAFNVVHPDVVLYARTQSAKLVKAVPEEVRSIIRTVVSWGAEKGVTVQQQARAIREVVGLPPQWSQAPLRLADELRAGDTAAASRRFSGVDKAQIRSRINAGTVDDVFVNSMMDTYTERLINLRASTIARTENLAAANFGQQQSWQQAVDDGVLPDTSRRYWIVTPDDRLCPICMEIPGMNPDGVGLDEPFDTPEGPVDYPPAPHPNCRCAVGLVAGGGSIEGADVQD